MTTVGCTKAIMGTTTYYLCKMTAGQLIDNVGFASEMPEWNEMSADEKMQRTLDYSRVVNEMVPYFINDPDRFYGSIIVDIYQGFEDIEFESVSSVIPSLPAAYRNPLQDMGFLTLPGNQRLIALDGQHRLLSMKVAIKGLMGLPADAKISPSWKMIEPHPELAIEEISVILVEHTDNIKIRKIFNKVNKYAKLTSRSDNIITSDDDIYAVIARKLIMEGQPLAPIGQIDVVNWKSNTLSQRSKHLTTLSALYTINETLLKEEKFSSSLLPEQSKMDRSYELVADFWRVSLERIDIFKKYIEYTSDDRPVSHLRDENLLLKPVTQMALAHVARLARNKGLDWKTIAYKLNFVDWSYANPLWLNILVIGSTNPKMITGKEAIRSAGMVISYMVMGEFFTPMEIDDVKHIIQNAHDNLFEDLPAVIGRN